MTGQTGVGSGNVVTGRTGWIRERCDGMDRLDQGTL